MEEVAQVESANLNAVIEGRLSILYGASAFITVDNINDDVALFDRMREVVDSGAFDRVEVVNHEGRAISYDATLGKLPAQNSADEAYVQAAMRGTDYVSSDLSSHAAQPAARRRRERKMQKPHAFDMGFLKVKWCG